MIEVLHNVDRATGYGSLRLLVEGGLDALGVPYVDVPVPELNVRELDVKPLRRHLHMIMGQPRWLDENGQYIPHGTKYRRWVSTHDFKTDDLRRTRPVTRVCLGTVRTAYWEGAARRVLFTMWETSELPAGWTAGLDNCDLILVPSEHSRRVIQAATKTPVRVVPLGLAPNKWAVTDRRGRRGKYMFLAVGDMSARKGADIGYQAFYEAFGRDRNDVCLVYKVRGQSQFCHIAPQHEHRMKWWLDSGDPNFMVLRGDWRFAALAELYRRCDCFLWPTRGEGWGLPPREAAATGMPVITAAHSGQADAREWAYVVPHADPGRPAWFRSWGNCGTTYEPDLAALVDRVRWVVEHRDEAAEFGLQVAPAVVRRGPADITDDILTAIREVLNEGTNGRGKQRRERPLVVSRAAAALG